MTALIAIRAFLNPWVALATLVMVLAGYATGHSHGVDSEALAWSAKIAEQKVDAARALDVEKDRVREKENLIIELQAKIGADHAQATNDIYAAGAKYDRLGLVFERLKARCGGGSGGTAGSVAAATAVDHGREGAGEDVSAAGDGAFGQLIKDADLMRVTVLACQAYIGELPKVVNQ